MKHDGNDLAVNRYGVITSHANSHSKQDLRDCEIYDEVYVNVISHGAKRPIIIIIGTSNEAIILIAYLNAIKMNTVITMATSETATPTYPMMFRARLLTSSTGTGSALSKIPKWVR